MDPNTYDLFRLQELITRREGMIAENKERERIHREMDYTEEDFNLLADEIRAFADGR